VVEGKGGEEKIREERGRREAEPGMVAYTCNSN
jgi:hypothetical protein